jgi:hypothetical protein
MIKETQALLAEPGRGAGRRRKAAFQGTEGAQHEGIIPAPLPLIGRELGGVAQGALAKPGPQHWNEGHDVSET